jgi:2-dehydropantoate 2-reductase
MKVLIVGAGAVGQTYGLHLQRGGASVSFFVKPKYADAVRAGLTLYPLNGGQGPARLEGAGVVTEVEEVAAEQWDQVWLAVSAPALGGEWLGTLIAAAGDALVVLLMPGLEERRRLGQHVPEERLVCGMISLIAYQAPLPGERRFDAPGLAFWFPPMGPSPFCGARAAEVVSALRAGGQPARQVKDVGAQASFGSAVLMPILLALEAADWRFARLKEGTGLALAARGMAEALAVVSGELGQRPPWLLRGLGPLPIRLILDLGPRVLPLDLEVYLAYHFVKVAEQTRQMVARYIALGEAQGRPTPALRELLSGVADEAGDAKGVAAQVLAARHS